MTECMQSERTSRADRLFSLAVCAELNEAAGELLDSCVLLWSAEDLSTSICTADHWQHECVQTLNHMAHLSTLDECPAVDDMLTSGQAYLIELGVCPPLDD